jgi:hypothetical protein
MIATCILQNHVGDLFRNHDRWCIGIANRHSRLGCASTPEGADAIHAKLQIHD